MKIRVYSSQFNYQYGPSIHVPYSIASLFSYINSFPKLESCLDYQKTFIFRNKLEEYVDSVIDPDFLVCSCYVWNWEITNLLAKQIKDRFSDCYIIYGGPQVPLNYEGNFFDDYSHVDMLIHQEGERTLKQVFESFLEGNDYSSVKGLETRDFRTSPQDRIVDLNEIPSPYLTNMIWDLVEPVDDINYIVAWETNRGCPFECTFCDWGSATKSKIRKWDMDKLFREIEWFADNKISYIDCCDANFGIFSDRDYELAKKLKLEKLDKGFPGRIRPAWAKVSSEKIIPIAKQLLDADLLRAVTLAVQSLDEKTLNVIRRKNIKFDKYERLVQQFRNEKIENYTEIITGLPGETIESYKNGLEQMMKLFPRPVVFIYNCGVFVNAPMNEPDYVKKHDIKTIRSPIYLSHSSIYNRGEHQEWEDIVVSTNTFNLDQLKEMYLYAWIMQSFHSLGILEYVSKFYHQVYNLKYIDFYQSFIEFVKSSDSLFGAEYKLLIDYMNQGYSGRGWDHHDENLADIYWPFEEATWLRCVTNSCNLADEMVELLDFIEVRHDFDTDKKILMDLIDFQVFLLMTMDRKENVKTHQFNYDWRQFLVENKNNVNHLKNGGFVYSYENKVLQEDKQKWCFDAIWVGRSQGNYKCHPEFLNRN